MIMTGKDVMHPLYPLQRPPPTHPDFYALTRCWYHMTP